MKEERPCKIQDCSRPRFANQSTCATHYRERAKRLKEEKAAKKLLRKQGTKKYQRSELKTWKVKTWKLMSEWVRRSRADWRGYTSCYTCPEILPWKEMQAGHWHHGSLDLDERNLKPQCPRCNLYLSGRLDVYTMRLTQDYGLAWVVELKEIALRNTPYSLEEIKNIHADLKEKLSRL